MRSARIDPYSSINPETQTEAGVETATSPTQIEPATSPTQIEPTTSPTHPPKIQDHSHLNLVIPPGGQFPLHLGRDADAFGNLNP